mgnify:CR=1 FL=1
MPDHARQNAVDKTPRILRPKGLSDIHSLGDRDGEGDGTLQKPLEDRKTKDSPIDFAAGLILHKKYGDAVTSDDVIATLYTESAQRGDSAAQLFRAAITIGKEVPPSRPLVYARVEKDKVVRY